MRNALFTPVLFAQILALCGGCNNPASVSQTTPADTIERIVLLAPAGGETFHPGDTVHVSVEYRNSALASHFVTFWFSPDNGVTMDFTLYPRSFTFEGQHKDTVWVVPDDDNFISDSAVIRVEDYSRRATIWDINDRPFRIQKATGGQAAVSF